MLREGLRADGLHGGQRAATTLIQILCALRDMRETQQLAWVFEEEKNCMYLVCMLILIYSLSLATAERFLASHPLVHWCLL
ncbi:hypothetical protein EON64_09210 [archaeon]|nr:MAG: hypothetical protein EON64_09210 [archaeon]